MSDALNNDDDINKDDTLSKLEPRPEPADAATRPPGLCDRRSIELLLNFNVMLASTTLPLLLLSECKLRSQPDTGTNGNLLDSANTRLATNKLELVPSAETTAVLTHKTSGVRE
jgi:hypothetical protein